MKKTLYDVLGVAPGCSEEELREAYYEKARILHPDTGTGDVDKFSKLANAWSVLEHKKTRDKYDKKLLLTMTKCPKCEGRGLKYSTKGVASKCLHCKGRGFHER